MAGADHLRQALERAHIGHHRHAGLTDGEHGVSGAQAHVARGDEVDAAADARAVHGDDHRLGALRHRRDARLEALHHGEEASALVHLRRRTLTTERAAEHREVEAGREVLAPRREHHGPHRLVVAELGHGERQVAPERLAHGVASSRVVEPQRRHMAVALDGQHVRLEAHRPQPSVVSRP